MDVLGNAAQVVAGVVLLAVAGDGLVSVASALAARARVTPAVIGLTVVAAGTSLPELFVSAGAALRGAPDMALGNVVGSNISNVGLILGLTALVAPLVVDARAVRLELPFLTMASLAVYLLCRDLTLDRVEGVALLAAQVAFTGYSVWVARSVMTRPEQADTAHVLIPQDAPALSSRPLRLLILGLLAALAGLGGGAELLVRGASALALQAGMSERVVGLTVVAIGTSLPELVSTLAAARRNEHGMAVANIVGSNIFNLLGILGATAAISPMPIAPDALAVDLPLMLVSSVVVWVLVGLLRSLGRAAGTSLVTAYAVYTLWLVALPATR